MNIPRLHLRSSRIRNSSCVIRDDRGRGQGSNLRSQVSNTLVFEHKPCTYLLEFIIRWYRLQLGSSRGHEVPAVESRITPVLRRQSYEFRRRTVKERRTNLRCTYQLTAASVLYHICAYGERYIARTFCVEKGDLM